ncbi:hypothetical protein [Shinella zoogloeoides]|uniref:hypothetical protein n=1 Tax=Shinella zoogloeoides TaxID=352475 RepID=UPI00273EAAC5|nr:hypothetical protein [Shinella zoogloeoides]WLR95475.1 hypothetical protein Q9316_25200 [Shinella zoogloeoides]
MSIYIDESIHARANFIVLAAVVASEEQTQQAEKALSSCGFVPCQDEFKSSMKMAGNPGAQQLRDRFQEIIGKCQIAFGVCSVDERDHLMSLAGRIIEAITHHGSYAEQTVYLDQGMKSNSVKLPDGFAEDGLRFKVRYRYPTGRLLRSFRFIHHFGRNGSLQKNGASEPRLSW